MHQQHINAILNARNGLGRKFDRNDLEVIRPLAPLAYQYVLDYEGTFEYLQSVKESTSGRAGLSPAQTAGVLNCMVAELSRRDDAGTANRPAPAKVPIGFFTVYFDDGEHETIRIKSGHDQWEGRFIVSYLSGPDNESDYEGFGVVTPGYPLRVWRRFQTQGMARKIAAAEQVLSGNERQRGEFGMAYALVSNRCARCGRRLTVPASIHSGYGPECRGRV